MLRRHLLPIGTAIASLLAIAGILAGEHTLAFTFLIGWAYGLLLGGLAVTYQED